MSDSFEIKADAIKYTLQFKFDAGTSRGVLREKETYFIRVSSPTFPGKFGYGEAGPLPKLSLDAVDDIGEKLRRLCLKVSRISFPHDEEGILSLLKDLVPDEFPSIRFALEVALLDIIHGGKRKILENSFYDHQIPMAINGLIWMGDRDFMFQQIEQKLKEGYNCIKIKIGSIDFAEECGLLAFIRERYSKDQITLRVDANGAFSAEQALARLQKLAELGLHSIEQPISPGQWSVMKALCEASPIPIALDEELIGVHSMEERALLLDSIRPQYIILKPTLVGGVLATWEWIDLAEKRGIGWWLTSALESNIGLNAIAQLAASYDPRIPQGLGTGQLYHNNINSPLRIYKGQIFYDRERKWGDLARLFGKIG